MGYCKVNDIEASLKRLLDSGAKVQQKVKDVGAGNLIARFVDADGNLTGLIQSA